MSKTVKKVFIIIGVLVLCLLVWALFFTDDGILITAYNSIAEGVNGVWTNISGSTKALIPTWNVEENSNLNDSKGNDGSEAK